MHGLVEIDKKSHVLSQPLTGETQLRAKRTRIKILRAIANKNGTAGFSDIKVTTGLSTGSIYYHLERMGNYVTKDSKHYVITEEGLQLLRDADSKYAKTPPAHGMEEKLREYSQGEQRDKTSDLDVGDDEDTNKGREKENGGRNYANLRRVAMIGGSAVVGVLAVGSVVQLFLGGDLGLVSSLGRNASLVLFIVLSAALASSFSFRGRRLFPQSIGYRGLMLSILSVAVIISGIIFISQAPFTGASMSNHYDNSMDALLSSYSLHWQVR